MSDLCPYCLNLVDPGDLDVKRSDSSGLLYHAPCWDKFIEVIHEADRRVVHNAHMAHAHGGYCPICRCDRPPGSECYEE